MRKLAAALDDKFAAGIVLYDGRQRLQYADKLWSWPFAAICTSDAYAWRWPQA
jgi:hypothetical protein